MTAPAGFLPSAATMLGVWALLAAEAMLLAEANLAIRAQQVLSDRNLVLLTITEIYEVSSCVSCRPALPNKSPLQRSEWCACHVGVLDA